jgi:hypothetical protein
MATADLAIYSVRLCGHPLIWPRRMLRRSIMLVALGILAIHRPRESIPIGFHAQSRPTRRSPMRERDPIP